MIAVQFKKAFVEEFTDAIKTGGPIPVPPEGWNGYNMLTLLGMLYASVFSQGPHVYQISTEAIEKLLKANPEKREAVEETFKKDIRHAIEFLSGLTLEVIYGEYDNNYEQKVGALLFQKADGGNAVVPIEGFKNL